MTAKTIPYCVEVDSQKQGYVGASKGNHLDEVYGSYSVAKARAWEHCESLCAELEGCYLCITSYNSFMFTAQFEFNHPENGRPMVCHITPSCTYATYTDMQRLGSAKDIWRDYAEYYDGTPHSRTGWCAENDKGCVVWVESYAYVIVCDEAYRVDNAFTCRGLRMRPTLSKVGCMCDEVVNELLLRGQAFCCAGILCHVKLSADGVIRVGYADDAVNGYGGNDAWDVVIPHNVGDTMTMAAACVDACAMLHGSDTQGAAIRLMD